MYTSAVSSPHRFQWEANAAPSQATNCGPTCATKIAQFYRDTWYGIEATRRLVTPSNSTMGTSASQQRDMLIRRGVPATVRQLASVSELHTLTDSGRRPTIIGMLMSRVPSIYRDHPFMGMHAVAVMDGAAGGFWVNDPNFSPAGGIRPDPDRGRKWYPDYVIQEAFINSTARIAVVPNALKALPVVNKGRGRVAGPDCNIRTSMSLASSTNIYARSNRDGYTYRRSDGKRLWSNGSAYVFYGWSTDGQWARVATGSGLKLYISRPVFVVTVAP